MPKRISLVERFWSKVKIGEPNECWEWQGGIFVGQGYGCFYVTENGAYMGKKAHRISWMLHNGEIPDGMLVCHTCDNPACVNPNHLWLGTKLDNNRDKDFKGRNALAKLTKEQVIEIRQRRGTRVEILAREFNISTTTIYDILRGHTWRWVSKEPDNE